MGSVLVLQKDLSPSISWMPGLVPRLDNVLEVLHMTPCTPALGNVPSHMAPGPPPSRSALRHSPRSSGTVPSLRSREENTGPLTCPTLTQTRPCASFPPAASTSRWHRWVRPGLTWHWPGVRGGGAWQGFHPQHLEPHKSLSSCDSPQSQAWMTFSVPGNLDWSCN